MRQLFPVLGEPTEVDPMDLYVGAPRPTPAGRPWVAVGAVTSVDGATAVDGVSEVLGGAADKEVFRAVRAMADVIVVGAGTVRSETYGPVTLSEAAIDARQSAGRSSEPPRLAVVSASLDLDPTGRVFSGSTPLVVTTSDADPERRRRLDEVAELVTVGTGRVDLTAAVAELGTRGAEVVVCEGGPSLIGHLVAGDLVDEWCLNIAPAIAGGSSDRVVAGAPDVAHDVELASLLHADGLLAARWIRRR